MDPFFKSSRKIAAPSLLVITMFRKNSSGLELFFGLREHLPAHSCKGGEKLIVFCIACCTHTFKCAVTLDFICDRLEVYHAATNKLINLRCQLIIDLPVFEVLKSFLFAHIVNFDDVPTS
jgi:hypothetical protein